MYKRIESILTELLEPLRPGPDAEHPEAPLFLLAVSGGIDSMRLYIRGG